MKKYFIISTLIIISWNVMGQTKVIAHRGYWDTPGSAQNSIASLHKADSIGCYGSEFDVWMTKDGDLVVNHDAVFKCKIVSKTSTDKLRQLTLKNGEQFPLLSEYLEAAKKLDIRLILELKKLKKPEKETEAVQKIVEMVQDRNLESRVEYISFSLHAVKEFIRLSPPGTPVYYLNGDLSPKDLLTLGCSGPDYNLKVYRKNPDWITESHRLGMKVNVWTVNNKSDMQWFIHQNIDFITTDNPTLLQEILSHNNKE